MMARLLAESEWKVFQKLQTVALARFCDRVLAEISDIAADSRKTSHQRYLAIYKATKRCDEELANAFDNPRRSDALRQLACLIALDLLTDEELSRFSAATRDAAQTFAGM